MNNYPPGVTGMEPEISGVWPCDGCSRQIHSDTCCRHTRCDTDAAPFAPDHCSSCCPHDTEDTDT